MKYSLNKIILLLVVLFTSFGSFAQYAVSDISKTLMHNANLVVRQDDRHVTLKNSGDVIVKRKYVYTVLNAAGDGFAQYANSYDKLNKITSISGDLYNAEGIKIKSLKKGDIKDYSNTDEISLADDNRVKVHNFNHRMYPYTVAYESTEELSSYFNLPTWLPVFDERIAIEKSVFTVETSVGYQLRHKAFNYTAGPAITNGKSNSTYSWQLANFNAVSDESYMPTWYEITPSVFIAPSSFELQKYKGSMNNWQEFGSFIYALNAGRDKLPDNIKQRVHTLADPLKNTREKVTAVYKYLQQNTRYISIQLGIGGWQTLDANFVAGNGYGDCKALNNYMYSMLKEVGVKSYYTLVKAGRGKWEFTTEFTQNQFNHIILCVPDGKDSIWLECTDQTLQPGYLSAFTSNRPVLLIDEKGGYLSHTPTYTAADNLQVRNITGTLGADGVLTGKAVTSYRAEQQDGLFSKLHSASKAELEKYMREKFNISSYEVQQFSFKESMDKLPCIEENISFTAKDYASVSGKRLFINPNVLSVSATKIKNPEGRKFDFELRYAFTDYDTVSIAIPKGYQPESIPADVTVKMPLGEFRSAVKISAGNILYTRYCMITNGRMPATDAKVVAEFFDKIYRSDHAKIVFVKDAE